jgi:hypothetical protein
VKTDEAYHSLFEILEPIQSTSSQTSVQCFALATISAPEKKSTPISATKHLLKVLPGTKNSLTAKKS